MMDAIQKRVVETTTCPIHGATPGNSCTLAGRFLDEPCAARVMEARDHGVLDAEPQRLEVHATRKPARVLSEATARVTVNGVATYAEVLETGLEALRETRDALFGYGVRGYREGDFIIEQTVEVFAHRD